MTLLAWGVARLLDFIIGDPQSWPHPVRWIGNLIAAVQRGVRRYCRSDVALRIGGGVMWIVVVGLTWGVCWGVLTLAQRIHPWLGWLVEVWMIFTVLAGRCLAQSARDVERPLRAGIWRKAVASCHGLSGATRRSLRRSRLIARLLRRWRKTPLTGLSRRSSSCCSAARRWRWPIKRSTPRIRWSAISTKIPRHRHG